MLFRSWIRETDGRFLLKLNQNLVVQEAYSVEGVEYLPWNLVAYDGSPMQINQDGSFLLVMMVSTRSSCEFRGKLEFLGDAETKLFSN